MSCWLYFTERFSNNVHCIYLLVVSEPPATLLRQLSPGEESITWRKGTIIPRRK